MLHSARLRSSPRALAVVRVPRKSVAVTGCTALVGEIGAMMEQARRSSVRAVNAVMTATYWSVGRRLVEFEQSGALRAGYGEGLLKRLSEDLTERFGKGFSVQNLENMRLFYRLCGEVGKS